jgi:hypothetical protein
MYLLINNIPSTALVTVVHVRASQRDVNAILRHVLDQQHTPMLYSSFGHRSLAEPEESVDAMRSWFTLYARPL